MSKAWREASSGESLAGFGSSGSRSSVTGGDGGGGGEGSRIGGGCGSDSGEGFVAYREMRSSLEGLEEDQSELLSQSGTLFFLISARVSVNRVGTFRASGRGERRDLSRERERVGV